MSFVNTNVYKMGGTFVACFEVVTRRHSRTGNRIKSRCNWNGDKSEDKNESGSWKFLINKARKKRTERKVHGWEILKITCQRQNTARRNDEIKENNSVKLSIPNTRYHSDFVIKIN